MPEPEIIQTKLLAMQLCVPSDWTNEQIIEFAEERNPAGTSAGWRVCEDGHKCLGGYPARVNCDEHPGFIHTVVIV